MGIFSKINFGLTKTRNKMSGAIDDLFDNVDEVTDDLYAELEEILVMADVGMVTAVQITETLKKNAAEKKLKTPDKIKAEMKNVVAELLYGGEDMGLITKPSVILVIGVNGVGKTTTIGKLAAMYKAQGKKVLLGAADTFRAAAIDQLQIWADRSGVDIVKHAEGADPAAVVFDTVNAAKARDTDIVIIDTAGRLHNKKNLMDELAKIYRVIDREPLFCSAFSSCEDETASLSLCLSSSAPSPCPSTPDRISPKMFSVIFSLSFSSSSYSIFWKSPSANA